MRPVRLSTYVVLCVVLLLEGCGGSSSTSGGNAPANSFSTQGAPGMLGRVLLLRGVGGASVQIMDSHGVPLQGGQTTTDVAGLFHVNLVPSAAFRVTATATRPDGTVETYSRFYDSPPAAHTFLHINAISSIVDHYLQHHEELTLTQAEARVRAFYGIPAAVDLGQGAHGIRHSHFNHGQFLRVARSFPGGVPAYLEALVGVIDGTLQTAHQSLAPGVPSQPDQPEPEPTVTAAPLGDPEAVSQTAADEAANDVTSETAAAATQEAVDTAAHGSEKSAASAIAATAGTVGEFVGRDLANFAINFGLQAVLTLLLPNPNQAVLDAINQVSQQINQVLQAFVNVDNFLMTEFTLGNFHSQANTLQSSVTDISTAWGPNLGTFAYVDAIDAFLAGDTQKYSTALGNFNDHSMVNLQNDLFAIQNNQLGGPGTSGSMIAEFQDASGGTRYLSNTTIEPIFTEFDTYMGLQQEAAIMLAAKDRGTLHNNEAIAVLKQYEDQLQNQFSMLPVPLPDDHLILDRQSGLLLNDQVFPPTPINQIPLVGESFRVGNYTQWHWAGATELVDFLTGAQNLSQPYDQSLQAYGMDLAGEMSYQVILSTGDFLHKGEVQTEAGWEVVTSTLGDILDIPVPGINTVVNLQNAMKGEISDIISGNVSANAPYVLMANVSDQLTSTNFTDQEFIAINGFSNVTATVSPDGTHVQAGVSLFNSTRFVDMTPYFYWTVIPSSNTSIADISNARGHVGEVLRLGNSPGGQVTFQGTRLETNSSIGYQGNNQTVTVTCSFNYAATPPPTLTSVYLTPRNGTVSGTLPLTLQLSVLGQFSDGTYADLLQDNNVNNNVNLTFFATEANGTPYPNVTVSSTGLVTVDAYSPADAGTNPNDILYLSVVVQGSGISDEVTLIATPTPPNLLNN